jgi:hypothetical protein
MSRIATPEPAKGSRWNDERGEVRVMAVVEGYVVLRRKGCAPFLRPLRVFAAQFRPAL